MPERLLAIEAVRNSPMQLGCCIDFAGRGQVPKEDGLPQAWAGRQRFRTWCGQVEVSNL